MRWRAAPYKRGEPRGEGHCRQEEQRERRPQAGYWQCGGEGEGRHFRWAGQGSQGLKAKRNVEQRFESWGQARVACFRELPGCHGEKGLGCRGEDAGAWEEWGPTERRPGWNLGADAGTELLQAASAGSLLFWGGGAS